MMKRHLIKESNMPEKSPFEMTHEDRSVLHASVAGILNASRSVEESARGAAKSLSGKAKGPIETITREEQKVLQKVKRVMDSSTDGISSLKLSNDDMSLLEGTFRKHAEILEREGKVASASARKTFEKAKQVESSLVEPLRQAFSKHAPHLDMSSNTASAFSDHLKNLYSSIKNLRESVEVEVRFKKR